MMWLYCVVKYRLWKEERQVRRLFPFFSQCDQALKKAYSGKNPYRIAKRFLQKRGASNVHLYGETYLTTLETLAKWCGLCAEDRVLELGCGRGRGALFLALRYGCRVTGVDWVPDFIAEAQKLVKTFSLPHVLFSCEDMHTTDLSFQPTVVYLYGTCLEEWEIAGLSASLKTLPRSTRILTVSYPLSDYSPCFRVEKTCTCPFPWGNADVYLQKVTDG